MPYTKCRVGSKKMTIRNVWGGNERNNILHRLREYLALGCGLDEFLGPKWCTGGHLPACKH